MENKKLSPVALGVACGSLWAICLLAVQLAALWIPGYGAPMLNFAKSIYPFFHATGSWRSILYGTGIGFLDAGVGGLVIAWIYNCVVSKCSCCKKSD